MPRSQMFAYSWFISHLLPDHTVAGSVFSRAEYARKTRETTAFSDDSVPTLGWKAPAL